MGKKMSRRGRKLQANGWERRPDYDYVVYTKNDMTIAYSDVLKDYYYISTTNAVIAHSNYFPNTDNLTVPNRYEFFKMFMKARNSKHAKSIMDNYLLKALIDKTL